MSQGMTQGPVARLIAGRWGPTRLALALGVVATPIVALGLTMHSPASGNENLPGFLEAMAMAAFAVLGAALVGGWLGGRLLGRMTMAPLVAVAAAWFVGVSLLTIGPMLLGIHYTAMPFCMDGCQPLLVSTQPLSGGTYWVLGMVFGVLTVLPIAVALTLLIVSRSHYTDGQVAMRASLAVIAYGAFWGMGMLGGAPGAIVAYVPLAIGVVIWTVLLQRRDPNGARVAKALAE
jgi:hypothetical protein